VKEDGKEPEADPLLKEADDDAPADDDVPDEGEGEEPEADPLLKEDGDDDDVADENA